MKQLMEWLRGHPLKSVLFTVIFTAISVVAAFRDDLLVPLCIAFIVVLVLLCLDLLWDLPKLPILLLAGLFCYTPVKAADPEPPQPNAAVGVAVVVICVGGFCIYKVVKLCQKLFPPKPTNAPPENLTLSASGGESGAAYQYSSIGSCYVPPPSLNAFPFETEIATTFTLNVSIQGGSALTSMHAERGNESSQTWEQFTAEMATHGLFISGIPGGEPQFERDGVPCAPSEVPLSFDLATGRVTQHIVGTLRRVSVERSPDLQSWFPFLATDVSDGSGFQVIDTTREGQMFYRIIVQ